MRHARPPQDELEHLLAAQGEGVFRVADGTWVAYAFHHKGSNGKHVITDRYKSLDALAIDLSVLDDYPVRTPQSPATSYQFGRPSDD